MPVPCKVTTLSELFYLCGINPDLAASLKSNPIAVGAEFGVTISQSDATKISNSLDLSQVAAWATQVNGYSAKVEQGVGI